MTDLFFIFPPRVLCLAVRMRKVPPDHGLVFEWITCFYCWIYCWIFTSGAVQDREIRIKKEDWERLSLSWRRFRTSSRKTDFSSLLFLVSRFCTPLEVKFHDLGTSKQGEENSLSNICFAVLVSILWRFYRADKKTCHVLFKKTFRNTIDYNEAKNYGESRSAWPPPPSLFCTFKWFYWRHLTTLNSTVTLNIFLRLSHYMITCQPLFSSLYLIMESR